MKSGRKASGAKYKRPKQAKAFERKGQPRVVKLGEKRAKVLRVRGGAKKLVMFTGQDANLVVNGKAKKAVIKNVLETPSNHFLARQNILVKGAVIETDLGKAKITNRPSQEGTINAVLVA
jgi:small subunit ribosomal protein S8e